MGKFTHIKGDFLSPMSLVIDYFGHIYRRALSGDVH